MVVVAVWQLPHFSLAMMSSAGPANARPLKARVALQATIVGINFMLGSFREGCGILGMVSARPGFGRSRSDSQSVGRFCTRG